MGCFHDVRVIKEDGREIPSYYPIPPRQKLTTVEMLWKHYIPTCSYVYRKKSFNADYFTITDNLISGDRYLELYNTFFGYIEYIPKVMASHIKHELGLSTSSSLRAYKYRVNNFIALYKGLASDARRLKKNEKLFYPKLSTSYAYGTISHIKHFQLVHALRYSMLSVKYLLAAPTEFIKQKLLKKY